MEWSDDAILLSVRRHGESGAVAGLLTLGHGRHAGLVRGGAGRRMRGMLQTGNRLRVTWRARLSEQLGMLACEPLAAQGALWLHDPDRLAGIAAACALAEMTLPEREPCPGAYAGLAGLLASLDEPAWPSLYVHWELGLLAELGYGLDLSRCAATGATTDLAYVSPRSGRAVSRAAAVPFVGRLLSLPPFLREGGEEEGGGDLSQVLDGLRLTGYFLERQALQPRGKGLPSARMRLMERWHAASAGCRS